MLLETGMDVDSFTGGSTPKCSSPPEPELTGGEDEGVGEGIEAGLEGATLDDEVCVATGAWEELEDAELVDLQISGFKKHDGWYL